MAKDTCVRGSMSSRGRWCFALILAALVLTSVSIHAAEILLFEELFEDTDWTARGWYDQPHMEITASEHIPGSGHSCSWHWENAGDVHPRGRGARVLFSPVTNVILSFHIKHSANWTWTGVNWHPHEFHFITDVDDRYVGPAYTHLTSYVEVVGGVPRVAIQDGQNVDEGRIGQDLVGQSEQRSVAGCNGDSDGHGDGDCYPGDQMHLNTKFWEPGRVYFGEEPGATYKGDWHHVVAKVQLNTVVDGIGIGDGVMQYRFDGVLIMDHHDIVFRTGEHPNMKINQFFMAPYFGPGVSHEQEIWIDDLRIVTEDAQQTSVVDDAQDALWGGIKASFGR
ncbi:MAG: hypothetical protein V1800_05270 [Candidatus Latescibacterota bacterium]